MNISADLNPDQLKVLQMGLQQPLTTIELKAPQLIAYYYGQTHNKYVLSLDKGMGKTIVYISNLLTGQPEHVIIVCPTNAMPAQKREIIRHFPEYADKFVFVRGTKEQRIKLWNKPGAKVFIMTMATLQSDIGARLLKRGDTATSTAIAPKWATSSALDGLIIDEFQKYIRRRSATWEALQKLDPTRLILSSGSAVASGPQDLWPALNLCDRKFWSTYWGYVNTWCETVPGWGGKGKEIIGPKNIKGWRNAVAPYVFHRRKDPRDYPPKSRNLLDVELPAWQMKLHDSLREELWAVFNEGDSIILARNKLDALHRARLALICPKALDESLDYGAGIEAIFEDASELSHFVISTPFRKPIPYLKQYLESKGLRVYVLMGGLGISPEEQESIIADFERNGGVMIQTIKYATSYEFLQPEHQYFLDLEYDPEDNKQAEDRMSRLSSTKPCFMWYIRFPGTYSEDIVENCAIKGQNVRRLMDDHRYWSEAGLK